MDRPTEWRGEHAAIVNHHENYIDRLAAYEDAGEEGRLIILPCKVGDKVYRIHGNDHVEESVVIAFHVSASGVWYWDDTYRETPAERFGKNVFLSHEEAEAALGGNKDGHN